MLILHKKDEFFSTLFPELSGATDELIINAFQEYYTYGPYKPKVTIDNEWIKINIDTPFISSEDVDYQKTVELCKKGNFTKARIILEKLIKKNPTNSEYHRIMGQISSEEGDQDKAIECLRDALRWDANNGWALLMMGNIYAKFKKDVSTAMRYYDQALKSNPNDHITITNIGALLIQNGRVKEAKKYFLRSLEINDTYPNTYYAMGRMAEMENDLDNAFKSTINAIKLNPKKDSLYHQSVDQVFSIAEKIVKSEIGQKTIKEYRRKLEFIGRVKIDIIEDYDIQSDAKFEFAENYNREKHFIKFKANYPAVEQLIMHELVHLEFILDAREKKVNKVVGSTPGQKTIFLSKLKQTIEHLNKKRIPQESIDKFCSSIFEGLITQSFNAPIDLFIENYLYNQYPELRPYQLVSLHRLIQEYIKASNDQKVISLTPSDILSKNKIYNLLNILQFKELYGIDLVKQFRATSKELKQAQKFYTEFSKYKDNKEPGKEYELFLSWAKELDISQYSCLYDEESFRSDEAEVDIFVEKIKDDLNAFKEDIDLKNMEMEQFKKSQNEIGTNITVVMYMVEALRFFERKTQDEIKKIALEIALKGTQGFAPEKKDYTLTSIPEIVFTGYQILAYYYVSWALALPEMVSQLQLPFEKEYKSAMSIFKYQER